MDEETLAEMGKAMEQGRTVEVRRNGELIAVIQQAEGQRGFSIANIRNGSDGAEYEIRVRP